MIQANWKELNDSINRFFTCLHQKIFERHISLSTNTLHNRAKNHACICGFFSLFRRGFSQRQMVKKGVKIRIGTKCERFGRHVPTLAHIVTCRWRTWKQTETLLIYRREHVNVATYASSEIFLEKKSMSQFVHTFQRQSFKYILL